MESGDGDFGGQFDDGAGKWQLSVSATVPIRAMSLLESPTGHLTNLSSAAAEGLARTNEGASSATHTVPLFMSASNADRQGFVRIINRSDQPGEVAVHAIDDSGQRFGPVTFTLSPRATKHFNSNDLEMGSADKGLSTGVGGGQGDWRLEIESDLDIEALAYIRTMDGFLTAMHDIVYAADGIYRAPIFNPGSNADQRSLLRLINPNAADAEVVIRGLDDAGKTPPDGDLCIEIPAGMASTVSAQQLESGDEDFAGRFGDGAGKWQLYLTSTVPILAMSLLESPTRHLTNLSTTVAAEHPAYTEALTAGLDCAAIVENKPVAIPDAKLEEALARALGKEPGAPILARDLATLRSLELRSQAIRDLEGLQYATNLKTLDLRGNPVDDVSALSDLPALTELDLSRSDMSDLTSIAGLTQLTKLDLHNNWISDLSPLSGLTLLTELDLSFNQINDLTPLSNLTRLRVLNLSENRQDYTRRGGDGVLNNETIFALTPLASLTRLEKLDLSGNWINQHLPGIGISALSNLTALVELNLSDLGGLYNVRFLSGLTRLRTLDLSDNAITDLSPLAGLTALRTLNLNENTIHDLSPLAGLTELEVLELGVNLYISDLRPLSDLTGLRSLNLANNSITDLSPLSILTGLRTLDLSNNSIYCAAPNSLEHCLTDIAPLSSLTELTTLNLTNAEVADLSPLSGLTKLTTLNLHSTKVTDLSPLSGLKALRILDLSGNIIPDLSPLAELKALTTLSLRGILQQWNPETRERAYISDISSLAHLTNLTTLDLSRNQISDLSPLSGLTALTTLNLTDNEIADLSPLSGLTALTTLVLVRNELHGPDADVSPLSGLTNLITLNPRGKLHRGSVTAGGKPRTGPQLHGHRSFPSEGLPTSIGEDAAIGGHAVGPDPRQARAREPVCGSRFPGSSAAIRRGGSPWQEAGRANFASRNGDPEIPGPARPTHIPPGWPAIRGQSGGVGSPQIPYWPLRVGPGRTCSHKAFGHSGKGRCDARLEGSPSRPGWHDGSEDAEFAA